MNINEQLKNKIYPKKTTQSEKVAEHIVKMIISGQLRSGEKIVESEIARELGVSRTPLREALTILEKDGYVTKEPYRGVTVRKFTLQEIKNYYEIRSELEALALSLAIKLNGGQLGEKLRENVILSRKAFEKQNYHELALLSDDFHRSINIASNNDMLVNILNNLRVVTVIMRTSIWAAAKDRAKASLKEHENIANAIIENKRRIAVNRIKKHVLNSWKTVKKHISFNEELSGKPSTHDEFT